jgi:hypothetical protein
MYFLKLAAVVFPALFGWATLGFAYAGPKAPPEFDITSFDATPDDDTDDTAAIQACITAAEAETPAVIYVPRGVYTINSEILIEADGITLRGDGTIQTKAGNTTMTSMIDVSGDDFACEDITIDANGLGVGDGGHCLRVSGRNNRIRAVKCYDPTDTCFQVHTGSNGTTLEDCYARGGLQAARVAGDRCYINRLRAVGWTGPKAVLVDPQIADAQFFSLTNSEFTSEGDGWEIMLLVDCGDGGIGNNPGGTQIIECGAATNFHGRAKYTIAAGHGFKYGDRFKVGDSTISNWDRPHKILETTGDVYARPLTANTFALYTSPEAARNTSSTTGRVNLIDDGTQDVNIYFTTPRAGIRTVLETNIDYTNDVLTTTETTSDFDMAEPVRISPHSRLHVLPGGIQDGGSVLLNTAYVSAGSADTGYFRPKRFETVVCSGNQFNGNSATLNDALTCKFHNVNNLLLTGTMDSKPLNSTVLSDGGTPSDTTDDTYYDFQSIGIGANVRKATMTNMRCSHGLVCIATSCIGELYVENCIFGSPDSLDEYAVENFHCSTAVFRNVRFACNRAAIEYNTTDQDVDYIELDGCFLDARNATSEVNWIEPDGTEPYTTLGQLVTGGKIFFRKNNVGRNPIWAGTNVTFANAGDNDEVTFRTSIGGLNNHCLATGDPVWFEGSDLPAGLTANTTYYVRSTGNNTLMLYTTRARAASTDLTLEIDIVDDGSGSMLAFSPTGKLGINPTGSGVGNLLLRCLGSAWELEDVVSTNASSASLQLWQGMKIWNSNCHSESTLRPGWIVTGEGERGSTGATLGNMPAVTP